jgi:hypothetical protein
LQKLGKRLTLAVCLLILCLTASLGNATTYGPFYSVGTKDGVITTKWQTDCPTGTKTSTVVTTGTLGSVLVSYDAVAENYLRSILTLSYNTSTLSGVVVDSCLIRIYMTGSVGDDWALGLDVDVRSSCLSNPLVVTDSLCWGLSDTLFSNAQFSVGWNYLYFNPTLINTSGYTDFLIHAETSDQWKFVCSAGGFNYLTFRMTEYANTANDPTLIVYGHVVGGERKRTWGDIVTDNPDVWPLRKQLIYGDTK